MAIVAPFVGIVSAIIGAYAVYHFGMRQMKAKREAEFREKQLSDFYGPIAAYNRRAVAYRGMALDVMLGMLEVGGDRGGGRDVEFQKVVDYNSSHQSQGILPLYRKMLETFTDRYWLAAAATREYYADVVRFVDLCERIERETVSDSFAIKMQRENERLDSFFAHVEEQVTVLQRELAGRVAG